jgi:hypothetical protein
VTLSNINIGIKFAKDFANDTREVFKDTRLKAKLSGKMLAHFLSAENSIFKGQSVSLVGFSLGTQVIKSTLNRLAKLGKTDLI